MYPSSASVPQKQPNFPTSRWYHVDPKMLHRTDTAIQLAVEFHHANRNIITIVLCPRRSRSPSRLKKIDISIGWVAEMYKIPFSRFQRAIVAGRELQTRSEAHGEGAILASLGGRELGVSRKASMGRSKMYLVVMCFLRCLSLLH